jgi:hypothetical protein
MIKNLRKKNTAENLFISFFDQILQLTSVQATEEAFNPQKRTSSTLKKGNLLILFYVCWSFSPSEYRSRDTIESGSTALSTGIIDRYYLKL